MSLSCNNNEAGTVYPSGAPEFIPGFCGVRVARSLVFCVVFNISLCVILSFLTIVLSALRFTLLIFPLVSSSFSCPLKCYVPRGIQSQDNVLPTQLYEIATNVVSGWCV